MWKTFCGNVWEHNSFWDLFSNAKYLVDNTCDVTYGNSGGSFMTSDGYVHAIVKGGYVDESANIAVLLYGKHYDNVLKWAGRG